MRWPYSVQAESSIPQHPLISPQTAAGRPRVFYGWWVVGATLVLLSLGGGTLDGRLYPVLCATSKRVRMEPDPARGGLLAKSSENGLFGPLEGWLADRFGPRRVASTGVLLMGFGFMVFSRVEVPLLFVIAFSLMAAGSSLAGFVPTFTAICWQPAKVAHFETREIMGWMEVWRAP